MTKFKYNREFMKSKFDQLESIVSDQRKGISQPPLEKPYDPSQPVFDLPQVSGEILGQRDLYTCLRERRSLRRYGDGDMNLHQLSFLLWATQGVDKVVGKENKTTFRPVPSGGARHPLETYMVINRVEGLERGIYRYLPLEHKLLLISKGDYSDELVEAVHGQSFLSGSAVVFIWSAIPYRSEWRYDIAAHKMILLDAGHVCQNLYLACEAIGYGTCVVADFVQDKLDQFIGVDGKEEFALYVAPVGKK